FNQPVIVEEYLPGREFTVAVLGNPPKVLPIIEMTFRGLPAGMPRFDHYEAKWVYENPDAIDPLDCPANISGDLKKKIEYLCLKSFDALEMADWVRIDVRLDKNNEPNFIEINCPPGIIPDPKENSRFPRAARVAGLDYEQMINEILKSACLRYRIEYR
ncbi:MAG: D-alanine--D-alanine ligase, partial [Candidatus Magasanikbacteria bacterium]|nr:D-alanine--D-alanine ligase [Candidatus Magasanikbacteria bacterium]